MDTAELLVWMDAAYDTKAWHGPNLRGTLRGVTAEAAAWRPRGGRHNIWELTVHAAYWKYSVRRTLTGEKRGSFVLRGSNWFARPEAGAGEVEWKREVALLGREHKELRAVVAGMSELTERQLYLVRGIAAHDLYHAGQVSMLKRLWAGAK
ncbi:MAG: DinB family protein [Acidobacteriota bacterium]